MALKHISLNLLIQDLQKNGKAWDHYDKEVGHVKLKKCLSKGECDGNHNF